MERNGNEKELLIGRRSFLKAGVAAAAFGSAVLGCGSGQPSQQEEAASGFPAVATDLEEMTIPQLQERMESQELTAARATKWYLDRIEDLDRKGPSLRSVIEVNPEALAIAESLDRERREKGPRGPLHGIPILLKDNIDTHDRMTTTAGSLALEGSIPPRDSFVAERLRAAGAVLLGKANLSEWANFRSEHSSSGWSGRGGQCRNPYALDRNPCGSSSGSGVAVSANLAAAAIGTETNGSIVCPSNANGVVGIKPTVGLVSRSGIIPISHTQDSAGPMARTVSDAVLVLNSLAGVDSRDPATNPAAEKASADYTKFLTVDGFRGRRVGICREFFGFHPRVDELMEDSIREIERLGATLVDPVRIHNRRQVGGLSYQVMLYEFKAGLNAYLESLGPSAPVKTLEEIIRYNEENAEREMPYFGQDILLAAQEMGPLTSPAYREALETCRRLSRTEGMDAVLEEKELDALVAPTGGPAWLTDLVNGDHFSGGSSSPAAISGYPNITVPMGAIRGLPVGISIFGRAWSEPVLIAMAYAFEQATKARSQPGLLPAVPGLAT